MHPWLASVTAGLQRDVLYATRLLRRDRALTLAVIAILAIAIGANAAVFSFVDTYLLRPLPYPDPDRLAILTQIDADGDSSPFHNGRTWASFEESAGSFYEAAVYSSGSSRVNLVAGSSATSVLQQRVGSGYFSTLGVRPFLGREFTTGEDVPGGPAVTILSHRLWKGLFDEDPDAIGETVSLKGEPYVIVGVMPPGFRSSAQADLWVPLQPSTSGEGHGANYHVLLRLVPDIDWAEAEARIATLGEAILDGSGSDSHFDRLSMIALQQSDTTSLREQLGVLWGAVVAVLLVSCVNVSGLLLVRGNRRRREIATRLALGGGRSSIIRQFLVESLVLAALGGIAGLLLASGLLCGLEALGRDVLDTWRPVSLDARVIAISAGGAVLTALIFGLAPAVQAGRVGIHDTLRSGGRGSSAEARRARRLLVVTEVAMSIVLLVVAVLLLRTFVHFRAMDPGFDPVNLGTFSVSLRDARYETGTDIGQLFQEGIRRVRGLPATTRAAAALGLPYERQLNTGFRAADFEIVDDVGTTINQTYVTSGYFATLGIPVLAGRPIDSTDEADSAPVAIVNAAFARKYFREEGALVGHHIVTADAERRIVGVVGNVKRATNWNGYEPIADIPTVYVPVSQLSDSYFRLVHTWFSPSWIVRFEGDPHDAIPVIEGELASVDPLLPIASVRLATEVRSQAIAGQRFVAVLTGSLALVSVVLAGLGIWGLVASTVIEQRREIGIRMALGAGPRTAVLLVATPSLRLAAVGALLGIGGSILASSAIASMLWGVSASDPGTYAVVAVLLMSTATVASLIPASRAARLDPAQTLRGN